MNPTQSKPNTQETLEGRYVNYFKVGYNADVFVIDYFQYFPEADEGDHDASGSGDPHGRPGRTPSLRLITSPADARQLLLHLESSIKMYERLYGPIQDNNTRNPE